MRGGGAAEASLVSTWPHSVGNVREELKSWIDVNATYIIRLFIDIIITGRGVDGSFDPSNDTQPGVYLSRCAATEPRKTVSSSVNSEHMLSALVHPSIEKAFQGGHVQPGW